jgi:16S rRNA (cytosine1402-N4)-methyltransferase
MEDQNPQHQRRIRYNGTHPKSFKEKHKELKPNVYAKDVAKIMEQGKTPAGMHRSICMNEIMDFLNIQSGQVGMDATLGYGGHSLEILKRLQPNGHLFATDVDPIELPRTQERLNALGYGDNVLTIKKMNFAGIDTLVSESGVFDFVLADLGVSSMQIDNPERGFSFKVDGPLDLRLNPQKGKSAAALLKSITQDKLESILQEHSDEPNAFPIAKGIKNKIAAGIAITTTKQLQELIVDVMESLPNRFTKEDIKKTCQRCFQALRIEVNNEFGVLNEFLDKLPFALKTGGRVAILTFHSGEDRRVKKSFQELYRLGIYSDVAPTPLRPSFEECNSNPRAKSAKLRWAIKGNI